MRNRKKLSLVIIYIAAITVCILLVYVIPSVLKLFDTTYIAEHGTISVTDEAHAYIIRDDTVYISDSAGEINRLCKEGDLVKGNSKVLELSGSGRDAIQARYTVMLESLGDKVRKSDNGRAEGAGYVSYYIDGKENEFSTGNLSKLSKDDVDSYNNFKMNGVASDKCATGEPIFKITKNGDWYLLYWVDTSDAGRYRDDSDVTVTIDGRDIYGRVTRIKSGKRNTRVEVRCNMLVKEMLGKRECDIEIKTDSAEGAVIETESLFRVGGQMGVLVKDKLGKNRFKPVKVKANNGEKAAVYEDLYMDDNMEFVETVKTYDEIVRHPSDSDIEEATGERPDSEEE